MHNIKTLAKPLARLLQWLAYSSAACFLAGCFNPNWGIYKDGINPKAAKAGYGYVDFHTQSVTNIDGWQVKIGVWKGKNNLSAYGPGIVHPAGTKKYVRVECEPGFQTFLVDAKVKMRRGDASEKAKSLEDASSMNINWFQKLIGVVVEEGKVTPVEVNFFKTSRAGTLSSFGHNILVPTSSTFPGGLREYRIVGSTPTVSYNRVLVSLTISSTNGEPTVYGKIETMPYFSK